MIYFNHISSHLPTPPISTPPPPLPTQLYGLPGEKKYTHTKRTKNENEDKQKITKTKIKCQNETKSPWKNGGVCGIHLVLTNHCRAWGLAQSAVNIPREIPWRNWFPFPSGYQLQVASWFGVALRVHFPFAVLGPFRFERWPLLRMRQSLCVLSAPVLPALETAGVT